MKNPLILPWNQKKSRNELLIPSRSWNLSDIDPDFFLVWCDTWAGYYIEVKNKYNQFILIQKLQMNKMYVLSL